MMMLIIFLITDISMVGMASLPESMEILQNTGKEC